MKKIRKKSVKGMTLVECLVALCVFAVAATVMVQLSLSLNATLSNASHMREKLLIQAPKADSQDTSACTPSLTKGTMVFEIKNSSGLTSDSFQVIVYTDTYSAADANDPDTIADVNLNYMKFDLKLANGLGGETKH